VEKVQQAISIETRNGAVEITHPGAPAAAGTSSNRTIRYGGRIAGDITMPPTASSGRWDAPRPHR